MALSVAVTPVGLGKCGRVLLAFSQFYFPFYGRSESQIFGCFDPYAWVSAYIYDIDEDVEMGLPVSVAIERLEFLCSKLQKRFRIDDAVRDILISAQRYYEFERYAKCQSAQYSLYDLKEISAIRSFDFRLMHRILASQAELSNKEVIFEWFRPFELLMELDDDLASIETDRERGTFNIAVMAERVGGKLAAGFIRTVRETAGQELACAQSGMMPEQRETCGLVLARYRQIVGQPRYHPTFG